jgi:tetratricopeptide (TPR) repeat protein
MGDQAVKLQDYGVAIKRYNEALEIDDKNMEVLFARTKAYLDMGDNPQALKDAENSINIEPDNPEVCMFVCLMMFNATFNNISFIS